MGREDYKIHPILSGDGEGGGGVCAQNVTDRHDVLKSELGPWGVP